MQFKNQEANGCVMLWSQRISNWKQHVFELHEYIKKEYLGMAILLLHLFLTVHAQTLSDDETNESPGKQL